jgi:hypothetical protein
MFEYLRIATGPLYPLCVTMMVLVVLTFLASIYAVARVDKLWFLLKKQQELKQPKKKQEVIIDLKVPEPRD